MAVAKVGVKVPLLSAKAARPSFDDCARVIVMMQFLVVIPSCAVITVVITLVPTTNGMLADAIPDVTATPFTVIVAVGSLAVGITCTEVMVLAAAAVKFK